MNIITNIEQLRATILSNPRALQALLELIHEITSSSQPQAPSQLSVRISGILSSGHLEQITHPKHGRFRLEALLQLLGEGVNQKEVVDTLYSLNFTKVKSCGISYWNPPKEGAGGTFSLPSFPKVTQGGEDGEPIASPSLPSSTAPSYVIDAIKHGLDAGSFQDKADEDGELRFATIKAIFFPLLDEDSLFPSDTQVLAALLTLGFDKRDYGGELYVALPTGSISNSVDQPDSDFDDEDF